MHVQRLEALQAKQQAVLKRKSEEAEAARRRLKVSKEGSFAAYQHQADVTLHCWSLQDSCRTIGSKKKNPRKA